MNPQDGEKPMSIVKTVGVMKLVTEGDKFWLIREKERSQDFQSEKEAWTVLRNGKVRWHKI
jgi:hypothetical protein